MKLNQKTAPVQTNFVSADGAHLDIDKEDVGIVIGYLSDDIYSNAIGSIVREYTSNAYDAHKDAGQKKPVQVVISTDSVGTYFAVRDLGTGMDKETILKYFKKYGKSSRRDNNDTLGAFGLGSKCFASYSDAVYYTSTYNGVERSFALFKSDPSPRFEFLHEIETKNPNGTTVKIYINRNDVGTFVSEIRKQLLYFDNVYFDVGQESINNYHIYQGKYFSYAHYEKSYQQPMDKVHAILGNVAYPIEFSEIKELGDNYWVLTRCPIGIKFDIGELPVTISREQIKYNKHSRKLIYERFLQACEELTELVNKNRGKYTNLVDFLINHTKDSHFVNFSKDVSLNVTQLVKWSDKWGNVKISELEIANGKYDKSLQSKLKVERVKGSINWSEFSFSRIGQLFLQSIQPDNYLSGETARWTTLPIDRKPTRSMDLGKCYRDDKSFFYVKDVDSTDSDLNKQLVYKNDFKDVYFINTDGKYPVISGSNNLTSASAIFNLPQEREFIDIIEEVLNEMRLDLIATLPKYSKCVKDIELINKIKKEHFSRISTTTRDSSLLTVYNLVSKERGWRSDDYTLRSEKVEINDLSASKMVVCGIKGEDDFKFKYILKNYTPADWGYKPNNSAYHFYCTTNKIRFVLASKRTCERMRSELHNVFSLEEFQKSKFYLDAAQQLYNRLYIRTNLKEVMDDRSRCDKIKTLTGRNLIQECKDLLKQHPHALPVTNLHNDIEKIMNVSKEIVQEVDNIRNIFTKLDVLDAFMDNKLGMDIAKKYITQSLNLKLN